MPLDPTLRLRAGPLEVRLEVVPTDAPEPSAADLHCSRLLMAHERGHLVVEAPRPGGCSGLTSLLIDADAALGEEFFEVPVGQRLAARVILNDHARVDDAPSP